MAPSAVAPSGFFVLRTPLLPRDVLARAADTLHAPRALREGQDLGAALAEDRRALVALLRSQVLSPIVREALFVASPSLDEAIDAWLADPRDPRARGVVDILVRYVARMSARATPFGLFSGCSLGTLSATTNLALSPVAAYRRHTRLDMHYLSALCDALHREPSVRKRLRYRPSSGLYEAAGRIRYAEAHSDPKTRELGYHLVSVERSDYLEATLERAKHGALHDELAAALVESDPDIMREEADAYIDELIDSQILTSDLAPPITGEEPIRGIVATLGDACTSAAPSASALARADQAIRALDKDGLGLPSSRYRAVAEGLRELPAEPELAKLFQVDLYKPAPEATVGAEVLREMERALGVLTRISRLPEHEGLQNFRTALIERYGERLDGPLSEQSTVPLMDVLDEEAGIGFSSPYGEREPSPLLEGLAFPADFSGQKARFGAREGHLLRRIAEAERSGRTEWMLDDDDLAKLEAEANAELPDAFALTATVCAPSAEALANGEFRLFARSVSGPSGALLLGRFCHGDPSLRRAVEDHLRAEEAARPEAIFAEVVHLPEGRHGNVLCRPVLRDHEICYLGRSGAGAEQRLAITDLRVGLQGGRIVLYSRRHAREVVPRLTSAHNHPQAALGVYRFLGALQLEGLRGGVAWTWGALASAPFLPRVSHGRTVLSAARWNLAKDHLAPLGRGSEVERYRAVQGLRAELRLPRWVGVADGDNVLPVDLDDVLHVDSFVQLVKARAHVSLDELFTDDGLVVTGREGRFVHELVVPFVKKKENETSTGEARPALATQPSPPERTPPRASRPRTFLPGSEWLYAKLYTGTAGADIVLQEVVAPFLAAARAAGSAQRWFFVRYGDPRWHVRVRVRGDSRSTASALLPALHDAAAPLLHDGRLWRLSLDTYEREIGRYGGPDAIDLVEEIFEADSDAALAIVEQLEPGEGSDERWRLALRGMHLLLLDLGLDLARRRDVLRRVRTAFGAEHRVDVDVERHLGQRFRKERPALDALLSTPAGADHPLDPGFEALAARSGKIAPIARELSCLEAAGRLAMPLHDLAPSLLHMHANRMLRAEHRAQELVLYDFLLRLYDSEAARGRR